MQNICYMHSTFVNKLNIASVYFIFICIVHISVAYFLLWVFLYIFVISYQNALLLVQCEQRPSCIVLYPAEPSMEKQFVSSLCIVLAYYYQIEYACSLVVCLTFLQTEKLSIILV